jgi:hypothetical protein
VAAVKRNGADQRRQWNWERRCRIPLLESWWIGAGPGGGAAAQGALPSAPPQLEPLVAITARPAARYFSQALTLSGLASTHFLAAAAGVILSAVM